LPRCLPGGRSADDSAADGTDSRAQRLDQELRRRTRGRVSRLLLGHDRWGGSPARRAERRRSASEREGIRHHVPPARGGGCAGAKIAQWYTTSTASAITRRDRRPDTDTLCRKYKDRVGSSRSTATSRLQMATKQEVHPVIERAILSPLNHGRSVP